MGDDTPLVSSGWRIGVGFASDPEQRPSRNFQAVHGGGDLMGQDRGVFAALTRAERPDDGEDAGARDAAQVVMHSLAEGYFGARRTFSTRRAISLAFDGINGWLFSQIRAGGMPPLVPVSVAALVFHNGLVGIAQIGSCLIYRYRRAELVPLLDEHNETMAGIPIRAVGRDEELSIDYAEEPVEMADRYVLIGGSELLGREFVYIKVAAQLKRNCVGIDSKTASQQILAALGHSPAEDRTVIVLDVLAKPDQTTHSAQRALAGLPLRPAPREGDVWDGFTIGKTLYQGRYTIVKAAHDDLQDREVALKIPLPSMLQDEVFAAGFMREAWIGVTVRGANVARYIELPPERRRSLYLVMPLYRGETLERRLHRTPPVSLPDGIGVALKLCEAVQDLAAIQIIHRDIKPDNVMLLDGNEIRLLDLGLAYLPGIDMQDAVKPGGTLRYMAPELLRGVQANARSEVFALGVTIYRMFAGGGFPFGQRETIPLAKSRPDLPGWLGETLQRALATDAGARFADAGALAAALQAGLMTGMGDAPAPMRRFTPLRIWQIIAGVFAAAFVFMLIRALR